MPQGRMELGGEGRPQAGPWEAEGERWGGRMNWEFGIDMCTLLYLKQMINRDLLVQGTLLNSL